MKKLLVSAIAMAITAPTMAANIYHNDTTSVDLGGRIEARYDQQHHDKSRGRLNVTGTKVLNDDVSAIGYFESEVNADDVIQKDLYGGLYFNKYDAMLTYGKQDSADVIVTDFTDVLIAYGAEANTRFAGGKNTVKATISKGKFNAGLSITDNTDFDGTLNFVKTYNKSINDYNDKPINKDHKKTLGSIEGATTVVGAATYDFNKFGVGASVASTDINAKGIDFDNIMAYQLAARYNGDKVYLAALGSYLTTKINGSNVEAKGFEFAANYHITPQWDLVTGYNYRNVNDKADEYNKTSASVGKTIDSVSKNAKRLFTSFDGKDVMNYATLGTQYKFSSDFKVYGEYQFNLLKDGENTFMLGSKYTF